MALRKPFVQSTEGFQEEIPVADTLDVGSITINASGTGINAGSKKITAVLAASADNDALVYGQSSANLAGLDIDTADLTMNGQKVTGMGEPTASGDATTKSYVDGLVISGGTIKEALLHEDQISDAEGVLASIALVFAAQPVSGDLVTTDDGVTSRAYGATAGGDVQYTIGGTAALSMQALVDAINGDGSATCTAALSTDLDGIAATVVVITEKDNDAGDHELYGVWTTQANVDVVDFTGENDYTKKALTDMPAASPAGTNFGVRRTTVSLTDGELHYVLNNDVIYGWDDAANVWNALSGSASIPDATSASGGGTKGKVTADSDKGLAIVSGVLEASIDAVTIDFSGGNMVVTGLPSLFEVAGTPVGAAVTAANLDSLTDNSDISGTLHSHDSDYSAAGHTHTHASTTGQGTDDHHAQAHVLDGADHTISGKTTGHILTATSPTTFAFAAPGAASEVPKVEDTLTTATDTVAVADPVYINGDDTVGKADAGVDAKSRIRGVIRSGAGAAPQAVEVVSLGPAAGVLSGATFNTPYYLQDTGGIGTSLPAAGKRVIQVGKAINGTDLFVDIIDYGKKAA